MKRSPDNMYTVATTLFIKHGDFILAQIECEVVVSDQSEDTHQYVVERIVVPGCELDGQPITATAHGGRPVGDCEIDRPRCTVDNRAFVEASLDYALWRTLVNSLDFTHIGEEVRAQQENHF